MSINSETPRLNPAGQTALGVISSFFINGAIHPISTLQSCMMVNPSLTLKTLRKSMSIFALYRGYWPAFGTDTLAFSTIYFANDTLSNGSSSLKGAIGSGLLCAPILCLGEGLARNRQVHGIPYSAILQRVMRPAGLAATALREIPFTTAVFCLSPLLEKQMPNPSSIGAQVVAGATTGAVAGFITSPFELIKTRVQTSKESLSIANVVRSVFSEGGWRGFFKGGAMRSLSVGLAGGGMNLAKHQIPHRLPKDFQAREPHET